jgi:hypothetical protein
MGDSRLCEAQLPGDLRHAVLAFHQDPQDPQPCAIADGFDRTYGVIATCVHLSWGWGSWHRFLPPS